MSFSSRLRKLRLEKGLKQEELAKEFNMSKATISNYERNYRKIGIDLATKFADFFDTSVDYLLGRTDKRKNEWYDNLPPELQGFVTRENIEYMKVLLGAKEKKISPEALEDIIRVIENSRQLMEDKNP
jgi:transcriptional regulator with XRE-family HTH domain